MKNENKQKGFLKILVVVVALVVIISILGLDLRGIVESEIFQNNLDAVFVVTTTIYNFLEPVFSFIWNDIAKPYLFEPIKEYFSKDTEETVSTTATSTP